jgi:hypothetical protein
MPLVASKVKVEGVGHRPGRSPAAPAPQALWGANPIRSPQPFKSHVWECPVRAQAQLVTAAAAISGCSDRGNAALARKVLVVGRRHRQVSPGERSTRVSSMHGGRAMQAESKSVGGPAATTAAVRTAAAQRAAVRRRRRGVCALPDGREPAPGQADLLHHFRTVLRPAPDGIRCSVPAWRFPGGCALGTVGGAAALSG